MQPRSLEVSPSATYDLDALTAAVDIPDNIATLTRQASYEKWLAANRLPISWLRGDPVHKNRSCTKTGGGTLCACTGLQSSEALENTVLYLRARAGRAHAAQQNACQLVELLREPGVTWSQLGRELDHFHLNVHWGRRYFARYEEERELARTSRRIPRVDHAIDAAFDVAASWYDHLVSTRVAEQWTGPDRATYLATVFDFDDDQTFAPGRRFILAGSEVVSTGEHATVRRVAGRDAARVLRGTYDNDFDGSGMDDWMMCPEPAEFRPVQAVALAQLVGPGKRGSLAEHVRALEAAFL